jgi:hypothetical protein
MHRLALTSEGLHDAMSRRQMPNAPSSVLLPVRTTGPTVRPTSTTHIALWKTAGLYSSRSSHPSFALHHRIATRLSGPQLSPQLTLKSSPTRPRNVPNTPRRAGASNLEGFRTSRWRWRFGAVHRRTAMGFDGSYHGGGTVQLRRDLQWSQVCRLGGAGRGGECDEGDFAPPSSHSLITWIISDLASRSVQDQTQLSPPFYCPRLHPIAVWPWWM